MISYRMRNHSGAYTMIGGESTQQLSNAPTIKVDLERRKFLQEQIASYRELKYKKEQERLSVEAELLE